MREAHAGEEAVDDGAPMTPTRPRGSYAGLADLAVRCEHVGRIEHLPEQTGISKPVSTGCTITQLLLQEKVTSSSTRPKAVKLV